MAEPVTLAEAKAALDVVRTDQDTYITGLIVAAREWVENYTGLILVSRSVTETFRWFAGALELAAWPVASNATVALSYVDGDGATQTIANARLIVGKRPARLAPAFDGAWPTTYSTDDAVTVTVTAGYANAAAVPQVLKQAIYLLVGHWLNSKEAVVIGQTAVEVPYAVESLCGPYRFMGI